MITHLNSIKNVNFNLAVHVQLIYGVLSPQGMSIEEALSKISPVKTYLILHKILPGFILNIPIVKTCPSSEQRETFFFLFYIYIIFARVCVLTRLVSEFAYSLRPHIYILLNKFDHT